MRILVTGDGGFVGSYLMPALAKAWPDAVLTGLDHNVDITQPVILNSAVKKIRPTHVIHLAALASIPQSFKDPQKTWSVNLQGTFNLIKAVQATSPNAVFIQIGSSDMYGAAFKQGNPVNESSPLMPLNPYAASKASADLMVYQEGMNSNLKVIRLRPFNHTGPRQGAGFVVPDFARQIVAIEQGRQEAVIHVGDLTAERDFTDVRDIVEGYLCVLKNAERLETGDVFNLASGQTYGIESILNRLLSHSAKKIEIVVDPTRLRKTEIFRVLGDASLIKQRLNWQPKITIDETLQDVLSYWRTNLPETL